MQNNSCIMKRVFLTLSLFLAILCSSCEKNVNTNKDNGSIPVSKDVNKETKKIKVTKEPDTIIDGVRIYNFKNDPAKTKEINLEEAINLFDNGVNNAKTCTELIRACASFDANIKKITQKDNSITISDIEKRNDVKSIRKISEEKSLKLCQTQQIR